MSIRNILVATASLAALTTGSAFAADLPSRVTAPAPYLQPVPVFTWTGLYVGVNAGAAFNSNNDNTYRPGGAFFTDGSPNTPPSVAQGSGDKTNFTGGGQIGYNWQVASFVFGIEADLNYLHRGNQNGSYALPGGSYYTTNYGVTGYNLSGTKESNYLGTVRGRLGYAVDRALFYVTGGFAYAGNNGGGGSIVTNNGFVFNSTGSSGSHTGYALGGGIEYAFTPSWTVKAEYIYADLGKRNTTYQGTAASGAGGYSFTTSNRDRVSLARVGLNYKF
jgi:outer membrane immunogenic protein